MIKSNVSLRYDNWYMYNYHMPSNSYPFENGKGKGGGGRGDWGSLLTAFILITPRDREGRGRRERIDCFEGRKRNFLSNAFDFQNSITWSEGSQSSLSYSSDTSGAFPCRFVRPKLTRIGSRSNKVFCDQRPQEPRHGLPGGWSLYLSFRASQAYNI